MSFLRSPKNKLLFASAALLLLSLLASVRDVDAATVARVVLGLAAVGGIAWWFVRNRRTGAEGFAANLPRLRVISRAGLSQRCGMALVEADGRHLLVVFGDGFAEVLPASGLAARPVKVQARRPRPARAAKKRRAPGSRKGGAL